MARPARPILVAYVEPNLLFLLSRGKILECSPYQEVVEVFDSNIFHTKVIYNEAKLDGPPFEAPEARGGFSVIIAFSKKAGLEEIVG